MNLETLRDFCLELPFVEESMPFGPDALVFKVKGKVFLLTPLDTPDFRFNSKCDPERAQQLREEFEWILPGYHMNKKHWNTVIPPPTASDHFLKELVRHSYDLVVLSLPKKVQEEWKSLS